MRTTRPKLALCERDAARSVFCTAAAGIRLEGDAGIPSSSENMTAAGCHPRGVDANAVGIHGVARAWREEDARSRIEVRTV